jgi:hypothetical protein
MTKNELLELIGNGENSCVEFKRDNVQNFDLAKGLARKSLESATIRDLSTRRKCLSHSLKKED